MYYLIASGVSLVIGGLSGAYVATSAQKLLIGVGLVGVAYYGIKTLK